MHRPNPVPVDSWRWSQCCIEISDRDTDRIRDAYPATAHDAYHRNASLMPGWPT